MTDEGSTATAAMEWYTGRDSTQSGPFKSADIENQIVSGHLRERDLLWRSGWPQWRLVGDVFREVFEALKAPPPEPAVPSPPPLPAEAFLPDPAQSGVSSAEPIAFEPAASAHEPSSFDVAALVAPLSPPASSAPDFATASFGDVAFGAASVPPSELPQPATGAPTETGAAAPAATGWRGMSAGRRVGLVTHWLLVLGWTALFVILAGIAFDILVSIGFARYVVVLGVLPLLSWLLVLRAITGIERRWLQIVASLCVPAGMAGAALLIEKLNWGGGSLLVRWLDDDGGILLPHQRLTPYPWFGSTLYPEREPLLLAIFLAAALLFTLVAVVHARRREPATRGFLASWRAREWMAGVVAMAAAAGLIAIHPAPVEFGSAPDLQPGHLQFSVARLSADGRKVLTASEDTSARIWDVADRTQLVSMVGGGGPVVDAVFDAKEERVATVSADRVIRIWNARSGALMKEIPSGAKDLVGTVRFSPDGTLVMIASLDGTARTYSPDTGEPKTTFHHNEDGILGAEFSPDGASVLTIDVTGAKLWSVASGELLKTFEGFEQSITYGLFHPAGQEILLSTGSKGKTVGHVVDIASGKTRLQIPETGFDGAITRDGRTLVVPGPEIGFFDWQTGALTAVFRYGSFDVMGPISVKVSLDAASRTMVTTADMNAAVWAIERYLAGDFSPSRTYDPSHRDGMPHARCKPEGKAAISWMGVQPSGAAVFMGTDAGNVVLCAAESQEIVRVFKGLGSEVATGAVSADGRKLAAAAKDGSVRVWTVDTGAELNAFTVAGQVPRSMAFSPSGTRLVVGLENGMVGVWDTEAGARVLALQAYDTGEATVDVAFGRDEGRTIVTAATNRDQATVKLWSAADGSLLRTYQTGLSRSVTSEGAAMWADVLANGRVILANQRQVVVLSLTENSADELLRLKPRDGANDLTERIVSARVDSKGARLALGYDSGRIEIYDIATAKRVAELIGHFHGYRGERDASAPAGILAMAFDPSGDYLASTATDETQRLWHIPSSTLVAVQTEATAGQDSQTLQIAPAFIDNGRLLAVAGEKSVTVWTWPKDAAAGLAEAGSGKP